MQKKNQLLFLVIGFMLLNSCATRPPHESGTFKQSDLVELIKLDSTFKLDVRYATNNNLVGRPVYKEARAFLQRPAAEALAQVNNEFKKMGYRLLIFDGYRPWRVTRLFWDITPKESKKFVADPKKGSRHNRGCAVDLSLYDMKTGKEVQIQQQLNSFDPNLKFTFELESHNQLLFLDILLIRNEQNILRRSVYRKPTFTGRYLQYSS